MNISVTVKVGKNEGAKYKALYYRGQDWQPGGGFIGKSAVNILYFA
jgi:hypothetical protein